MTFNGIKYRPKVQRKLSILNIHNRATGDQKNQLKGRVRLNGSGLKELQTKSYGSLPLIYSTPH